MPTDLSDSTDAPASHDLNLPTINKTTGIYKPIADSQDEVINITHGDYTYQLSDGHFTIIQTWPADQTQELSSTPIEGTPRALFPGNDVVWIVSELSPENSEGFDARLGQSTEPRTDALVKVTWLQTSNPSQPSVIRDTLFEAHYVDAHKDEQRVYLALNAHLDLQATTLTSDNPDPKTYLPVMMDNTNPDAHTVALPTSVISTCESVYQPDTPDGTGTLTILGFDLDDPLAEPSSQTLLGNSSTVLFNQKHLYVASMEDPNWIWLPVMQGSETSQASTTLHKFSLDTAPQYLASGRVNGHLLNPFAMDEYQDSLRLVTLERSRASDSHPESTLYILEQTQERLDERARLEGLGQTGDTPYAVRLSETRGYLATVNQNASLITLDLSDPDNPSIAGELAATGLSAYLQPTQGDRLLSLDQDSESLSITISLFDVSDLKEPVLLSAHSIDNGRYTQALYNYPSFDWFENEQTLAIPITQWNSQTSNPDYNADDIFNGLELYKVTPEGEIQSFAEIDHDVFYQDPVSGDWLYPSPVSNSFIRVDDENNRYIFSFSDRGVLVNNLDSAQINLAQSHLTTGRDHVLLYNNAALSPFNNCDDLKSFLIETRLKEIELYNFSRPYWPGSDDFSSAPLPQPPTSELDQNKPEPEINDVTETNNQVAGVDEADFIKTNGNFTYLLSGGVLVILKTWPADQSTTISRTTIDGSPYALFVYDDMVWIVSQLDWEAPNYNERLGTGYVPRLSTMTQVTLVRITDPAHPIVVRKTVFESRYVAARRIDQHVYLVVRSKINFYPSDIDLDTAELSQLVPVLADNTTPRDSNQVVTSPICGCESTYRPEIADGTGTVSILGFDLENPLSEITSQTLLGNSGTVYANRENLYIASVEDPFWYWEPVWAGESDPIATTTVHKFSLLPSPQYLASGRVKGHVINHFAMDEYQDTLRLVTTEENWWSGETNNRLYVLSQSDDQLAQRAQLENLGHEREGLHAVRFVNEQAFIVTFGQEDPLITLDLADSQHPKVAGELEVPGLSTYLHPIEGRQLLTIGRESNGAKISLYDINDLSHPSLIANHLLGYGRNSGAGYDHHAFTWFEREKLLAIPVQSVNNFNYDPVYGYDDLFIGLKLFKITLEEGIQPYASIDHDIFYENNNESYNYVPEGIRRSFFVTDDAMNSYIYSISYRGLLVNDLANPDVNLAEIDLSPAESESVY
ncbi:MAG: beta-propeller domain-containing protein [Candidatus Thiodiazotropha sp.]